MRKIILDCDPGLDDAMAILLANASAKIRLLAVTTVAGNQTLAKTTLNARRVMTVGGMFGTLLAAGTDRPLLREQITSAPIHGDSGLDGYEFPSPEIEVSKRHAVDVIIETLIESDRLTLVPTGPLTNIAMALRKNPLVLPHIEEIVLMGGSYTRGNVTPVAEFNIYADPEAADIVFRSGAPITMVGLDLTHQARVTADVLARIKSIKNSAAEMSVGLMTFYSAMYSKRYGIEAPPLHDPCAVARVIDPEIVRCQPANVMIETRGTWTYGATVCDLHGVTGRPANAQVATELDTEKFWKLMIDALTTYS